MERKVVLIEDKLSSLKELIEEQISSEKNLSHRRQHFPIERKNPQRKKSCPQTQEKEKLPGLERLHFYRVLRGRLFGAARLRKVFDPAEFFIKWA